MNAYQFTRFLTENPPPQNHHVPDEPAAIEAARLITPQVKSCAYLHLSFFAPTREVGLKVHFLISTLLALLSPLGFEVV